MWNTWNRYAISNVYRNIEIWHFFFSETNFWSLQEVKMSSKISTAINLISGFHRSLSIFLNIMNCQLINRKYNHLNMVQVVIWSLRQLKTYHYDKMFWFSNEAAEYNVAQNILLISYPIWLCSNVMKNRIVNWNFKICHYMHCVYIPVTV